MGMGFSALLSSAMSGVAHILVVDDDEPIAASVRRALEYEGYRVSLAADGPSAIEAADRMEPDLVVLDVMLPGVDGMTVCRRLRAGSSGVMVLMLTARDATPDRVAGLDAGADDYLVKPFAFADLTLDEGSHEVRRGERQLTLTAQEFALLRHFMRHPRQVLSRAQLLEAVWGIDFPTASNVVDVYVGYLRGKLGEPRLLHTVRGVGYVLRQG